ncbi:lysylphosphatidylglycerol synthase domain-containing protein [Vulgatibacter sp.]|uniref:lysylphosphatidylglycerol synthase domain-containing protein n=1 Tax=Vulgatibacter sp. TaxID=1971226 RepID=UPI003564AED3
MGHFLPRRYRVRISKTTRAILATLVSCALLGLLLSQLDLAAAAARFRQADAGWLLLGALWSLLVLLVRGVRYAVLNRHARWPLTTAATAIQVFLNRVTPLRLGELSLPWILRRHAGEDAARSIVSVVLVRLVDLAVVVAAVVLGLLLRRGGEGAPPLLPSLAALAALALGLATFRLWLRLGLDGAAWLSRRLRLDRFPAVGRILAKLRGAVADGESLGKGQTAWVAATSLAIFVGQMLLFDALLQAFGVSIPVLDLAQGGAVAQAGAAIPVAAFGSFGTQEASWVAGFVWVGVPMQDALVTAIACQFVTLAFAALFALPAWLWLARQPLAPGAAEPAVR